MATVSVGVREFREKLSEYLEADGPVEITRRGEPIGQFVPRPKRWTAENRARLERAHAALQQELKEKGIDPEDLSAEAEERLRANRRASRR